MRTFFTLIFLFSSMASAENFCSKVKKVYEVSFKDADISCTFTLDSTAQNNYMKRVLGEILKTQKELYKGQNKKIESLRASGATIGEETVDRKKIEGLCGTHEKILLYLDARFENANSFELKGLSRGTSFVNKYMLEYLLGSTDKRCKEAVYKYIDVKATNVLKARADGARSYDLQIMNKPSSVK